MKRYAAKQVSNIRRGHRIELREFYCTTDRALSFKSITHCSANTNIATLSCIGGSHSTPCAGLSHELVNSETFRNGNVLYCQRHTPERPPQIKQLQTANKQTSLHACRTQGKEKACRHVLYSPHAGDVHEFLRQTNYRTFKFHFA